MDRPYVVLVNNIPARFTLTMIKAKKVAAELSTKGYRNVSIAEKLNGGN